MTLQQLRYIITVAAKGTISEAAKALYISQPSLTAAITELEREMGIIIFSRTNKGVILTVEGEEFSEMDLSAIKEIGNIIAGSYLNALSSMTNLTITPTIPYIAIDMAAAILSVPAIQFGKYGDNALMIETEFGDDVMINGYFILLPELESYDKILSSLGISL